MALLDAEGGIEVEWQGEGPARDGLVRAPPIARMAVTAHEALDVKHVADGAPKIKLFPICPASILRPWPFVEEPFKRNIGPIEKGGYKTNILFIASLGTKNPLNSNNIFELLLCIFRNSQISLIGNILSNESPIFKFSKFLVI